jgi:hypothetical protein
LEATVGRLFQRKLNFADPAGDAKVVPPFRAVHDAVIARRSHRRFFLPHSSSSSRFTAGAAEFFILGQSGERPER